MKVHWMEEILAIRSKVEFDRLALGAFHYHHAHNPVYRSFTDMLHIAPSRVCRVEDIPFLPVSFFKSRRIIPEGKEAAVTFQSSGTTGMQRSSHLVADLSVYDRSLTEGFRHFYGEPAGYNILALVPAPAEQPYSSLAYMVDRLMERAHPGRKNFLLHDFAGLEKTIREQAGNGKKNLLIGLTSALMDFTETFNPSDPDLIVMETGGMKGRRKELVREELHRILCDRFGVSRIHSEYGMSELLSQAYSKGNGIFSTPPWMQVMIRDANDPLSWEKGGSTGAISIIDLANINSCPFIATQDLGKMNEDGTFEVLGRFGNSEMRGCNLML